MPKQAGTQLDVDPIGGVRENVGPEDADDASNKVMATRPSNKTSSVPRLRCTTTLSIMTWKKRGEIRPKIWSKNEANRTSRQNPAIFVDRLNEPGDVEFPGQVAQRGAPGNQDQAPVPTGLEFGATEELRSANGGVLNQCLVIDQPGQHQKAAIAAFRQGGERDLGQPPPIRDDRPRLELQLLGAPQNLRGTKGRAGELMADLRRVDGQFMETQNQNERIDARAWNALPLQTHRGPPHSLTLDVP